MPSSVSFPSGRFGRASFSRLTSRRSSHPRASPHGRTTTIGATSTFTSSTRRLPPHHSLVERTAETVTRLLPNRDDCGTINRREGARKRTCPTLPMSPLRSEPGRTRWVPCGPARLPTRRARLGLPRFGCWFYIGCGATNRVGHRARVSEAATPPARSSSGSAASPSPPGRRPRRAPASPRSRGRVQTGRGRRRS